MDKKIAIIIGAGPAGLTAAYELLDKTDIRPIIFEMTDDIGGISKTVNYKGNRIDIGGHRFFSKSDRVMTWWQNILPLQGSPSKDYFKFGRGVPITNEFTQQSIKSYASHKVSSLDPEKYDKVMLIRHRLSRIFFMGKFFNYPISLTVDTIANLGLVRILKIMLSYIRVRLFPLREERSLEDFLINRFGKQLYMTFFKDYTEKVWGVPCRTIKPEWGAQRIKGLSVSRAIRHCIMRIFSRDSSIAQKETETSLIEQFMYPKLGPGQMWEEVARIVTDKGGEFYPHHKIVGVSIKEGLISDVTIRDERTGIQSERRGDYFFSSMPIKDLIFAMGHQVPGTVKRVAEGLVYRDFITVGLLLSKLKIANKTGIETLGNTIPDNWIYIQERDVKVGRVQIFNNWSPYMVKDEDTVWIGLEYFCTEGDDLWCQSDDSLVSFASGELVSIGFVDTEDVLDSVVIRMAKAYPAYFGSYDRFADIRDFTDQFENLFLIGRNGMHRYNNADHSMLTAIAAVENIMGGVKTKDNLWSVNVEEEYHEDLKGDGAKG